MYDTPLPPDWLYRAPPPQLLESGRLLEFLAVYVPLLIVGLLLLRRMGRC